MMKTLATMCALLIGAAFSSAQTLSWISPIEGKTTVETKYGFGPREHPVLHITKQHNGVDFKVPLGTKIRAAAAGTVIQAKKIEGYGVIVRLRHANGYETLYAHLKKLAVKKGDTVTQGQTIAYSGNSGISVGPHLHYEILRNGENLNPEKYIAFR